MTEFERAVSDVRELLCAFDEGPGRYGDDAVSDETIKDIVYAVARAFDVPIARAGADTSELRARSAALRASSLVHVSEAIEPFTPWGGDATDEECFAQHVLAAIRRNALAIRITLEQAR